MVWTTCSSLFQKCRSQRRQTQSSPPIQRFGLQLDQTSGRTVREEVSSPSQLCAWKRHQESVIYALKRCMSTKRAVTSLLLDSGGVLMWQPSFTHHVISFRSYKFDNEADNRAPLSLAPLDFRSSTKVHRTQNGKFQNQFITQRNATNAFTYLPKK